MFLFVWCSLNSDDTNDFSHPTDPADTVADISDWYVEPSEEELNQFSNITEMISSIPNIYSLDNSFKSCVAYNIDSCIWDFSYNYPNKASCDDFITESSKNNCKTLEVTSQALEENDISLCENLSTWTDACKLEFIISTWVQNWNILSCDSLSEGDIMYCKNQISTLRAAETRELTLCDDIVGDWYEKEFCIEEVQMLLETDALIKAQEEENKKILEEQQNNEVDNDQEVE